MISRYHGLILYRRRRLVPVAQCFHYSTRKSGNDIVRHTAFQSMKKPDVATLLTRQIVQCAKQRDWRELLDLYERRKLVFSSVHFSKVLQSLGRLPFHSRDPRFLWLINDLEHRILRNHAYFVRTGIRNVANIVEAFGRLQLRSNKTVRTMVQQIDQPDTAAWVLESGTPNEVASILEAAVVLQIPCPNFIAQLDRQIEASASSPGSFLEQAKPRDLSIYVWASAKFRIRAKSIISSVLEHRCGWICEQGDPVDIGRIAHASFRFHVSNILAPLEEYARWIIDEGKPVDVAETAVAIASLGASKHTFWKVLDARAQVFVLRSSPKPVAQILAIMAKHHITTCPHFLAQIRSPSFVQRLVALKSPQPAVDCVWACAKMGRKASDLFQEVDAKASWVVRNGSSRVISSCLWAFAKLGVQALHLIDEIDKHWDRILDEPQALANCMWSCAKIGVLAPRMFAALEQKPSMLYEKATPQAIANTLWAYATLHVEAPELFNQLASCSTRLVQKGTTQNVANAVWACATMDKEVPILFEALERRAEWMATKGTPQELSNCVWACAKLNQPSPQLFSALNNHANRLFKGTPQNVSQSVWACYKMEFLAPKLWSALETHAVYFGSTASPQALATVAHAATSMDVPSPRFFLALNHNADRIIGTGSSRSTAAILMACVAKKCKGEALFVMLDSADIVEELFSEVNTRHIAQILSASATVGHKSTPLFQLIEHNSTILASRASLEELSVIAQAHCHLKVPIPQQIIDMLPKGALSS